jgi:putative endonuclease
MNSSESPSYKGSVGEKQALKFLKKKKYRIVETNFECPYGEIDIIALQGGTLVFIEVKSRYSLDFGFPAESVNHSKQLKLTRSALYYVKKKHISDLDLRFDVVSIYFGSGPPRIELICNAFEAQF